MFSLDDARALRPDSRAMKYPQRNATELTSIEFEAKLLNLICYFRSVAGSPRNKESDARHEIIVSESGRVCDNLPSPSEGYQNGNAASISEASCARLIGHNFLEPKDGRGGFHPHVRESLADDH